MLNEVEDNGNFRVILITQGVSRIVSPLLQSKNQIVGIIESAPRESYKSKGLLWAALRCCYQLLNKKNHSLKSLAYSMQIPYYFMNEGNSEHLENWVNGLKPDLIVVYSMSQLLKENIIRIPKYGVINLHPSWLPMYRGPFPDFWMYYYTDLNPGVTVHYIDIGEDTGDIIGQVKYQLKLGTKSPQMLDLSIGQIGSELLIGIIDQIKNDTAPRIPQPKQSPTIRARKIKKEEHRDIIDWNHWNIERIWHLLRGTEQWLDAIDPPKGLYWGQRWEIMGYEKCKTANEEVGTLNKRKSYVICRDGIIHLSKKFVFKNLVLKMLEKYYAK